MLRYRLAIISLVILVLSLTLAPRVSDSTHAAGLARKSCATKKSCKRKKSPSPKPSPTPTPTVATHPSDGLPSVAVSPHLDTTHTSTQTISPDGGSISVTGADGTVYTLVVPKNALISPEDITMTALSGVTNLPGGHPLAAGVQLDPEGLQLDVPATLTIALAHAIPAASQMTFASQDSGADFHLYPRTASPQTVTMQILHFTEYGVQVGSMPDLSAQLSHGAVSYLSLAEQLRSALQQMHDAALAGLPELYTPNEMIALWSSASDAWYQQKVLPEMQAASALDADDSKITGWVQDALAWERQVQLLGLDEAPEFHDRWMTIIDLLGSTLKNAYSRAYKRCTDQHQVDQVARLFQIEHSIELMGYFKGGDILTDVGSCLHFELDMDATYTSTATINSTIVNLSGHVQVRALPLRWIFGTASVAGDGQIDYPFFDANGGNNNCSVTPAGVTLGDPFRARLTFNLNTITPPGGASRPPGLKLEISAGGATEHARVACAKPGYNFTFDYHQYEGEWDLIAGTGPIHIIPNLNLVGGPTYASWTPASKTVTLDNAVHTVKLSIVIRHTPGQ